MRSNFIEAVVLDWSDFKSKVQNRAMCPQWYEMISPGSNPNQYQIFANDGYLMFSISLIDDGGTDVVDFKDNFKDDWNQKLEFRDENGLLIVHDSPRPCNKTTYFSGAGDTGGLSSGNKLLFKMTSSDTSKQIDIEYSEDIFIKDAIIQFKDAPFGSYIDVQIVHPVDGVVANYITKLFLIGTSPLYINSEDSAKVAQGLKIRVIVYNSSGSGDEDPAGDFRVTGTIEMYRSTIV